jgi:SAM-dependent methyltransferase
MTPAARYDRIGRGYSAIRRPDSRIAAAIWAALGDAATVVNVGAGAGSYEPSDRKLIAVEPSRVMIAQRPPDAAPAIQAVVEALPLKDHAVDAAMAVLSLHHWEDVDQGLGELLRVACQRVVLVTMDVGTLGQFWLIRDYLPETLTAHGGDFPSTTRLLELLPRATVGVIPVPRTAPTASWRRSGDGPKPTSTQASAPPPRPGISWTPRRPPERSINCEAIWPAASGTAATVVSAVSQSLTSDYGLSALISAFDGHHWQNRSGLLTSTPAVDRYLAGQGGGQGRRADEGGHR